MGCDDTGALTNSSSSTGSAFGRNASGCSLLDCATMRRHIGDYKLDHATAPNVSCSVLATEVACALDEFSLETTDVAAIAYAIGCVGIIALILKARQNFETRPALPGAALGRGMCAALSRMKATLAHAWKSHPDTVYFLVANCVFIQGPICIIINSAVYMTSQLNMPGANVSLVLGVILLFVVIGAWLQGAISRRIGPKPTLQWTLLAWLCLVLLLALLVYRPSDIPRMYVISPFVGVCVGMSFSGARAVYADLVPLGGGDTAAYWSLFSLSNTSLLAVQPAITASIIEGFPRSYSLRIVMGAACFYFFFGGLLLLRVDVERAQKCRVQITRRGGRIY